MGIVQERIANVDTARQRVLSHCLCLDLREDRHYYTVVLAPGYFPDGIRASKGIGSANALDKIYTAMERVWVESYP